MSARVCDLMDASHIYTVKKLGVTNVDSSSNLFTVDVNFRTELLMLNSPIQKSISVSITLKFTITCTLHMNINKYCNLLISRCNIEKMFLTRECLQHLLCL
jgi:hypothetical protein